MNKIIILTILIAAMVFNINVETLAMNKRKLAIRQSKEIFKIDKDQTRKREAKAKEKLQKQYIKLSNNQKKIEQEIPLVKKYISKKMPSKDCLGIIISFLKLTLSRNDTKIILYTNNNPIENTMTRFYKIISENIVWQTLTIDCLTYLDKIIRFSSSFQALQVLNIDIDKLEVFSIIAKNTKMKKEDPEFYLREITFQLKEKKYVSATFIPSKSFQPLTILMLEEIKTAINTQQGRSIVNNLESINSIINALHLKSSPNDSSMTPILNKIYEFSNLLASNPSTEKDIWEYIINKKQKKILTHLVKINKRSSSSPSIESFSQLIKSHTSIWDSFQNCNKNHQKMIIENSNNIKSIIEMLSKYEDIQTEFIKYLMPNPSKYVNPQIAACEFHSILKNFEENKDQIKKIWDFAKTRKNNEILDNIIKNYDSFIELFGLYPNILAIDIELLSLISNNLDNLASVQAGCPKICHMIFKNKKLKNLDQSLAKTIIKELYYLAKMVNTNNAIQDQILNYLFENNNDDNELKNIIIEKSYQVSLILSASTNKQNAFKYLTDLSNKDKTSIILKNGAKIKKILEHNTEYWKTIIEHKSDDLSRIEKDIDQEFKKHDKAPAHPSPILTNHINFTF